MASLSEYSIHVRPNPFHDLDVDRCTHGWWSRPLSGEQDFHTLSNYCQDRTNMAGFLKATAMPIRTNSVHALAQDFFFPNVVHFASRVGGGLRPYAYFIFFLWDFATLSLRMITLIPRAIYNAAIPFSEHPLCSYLKDQGLPEMHRYGNIEIHLLKRIRFITTTTIEAEGKQYRLQLSSEEIPVPFNLAGSLKGKVQAPYEGVFGSSSFGSLGSDW